MPETWTFHSAGQLLFGFNASRQLGDAARRLGIKKLFVVTDGVLANVGVLAAVRDPLTGAGVSVEVFTGGEPEPSLAAADACIDAARRAAGRRPRPGRRQQYGSSQDHGCRPDSQWKSARLCRRR